MVGSIIEVFNRTERTLIATKDGRDYPIPPGRSHITSDVFRFAQTQNPVPGSENPSGQYESLISFVAPKGQKQPASQPLDKIPEEALQVLERNSLGERINREQLPIERQGAAVQSVRTVFPRGRVGVEAPSTGMVDPGRFGGE